MTEATERIDEARLRRFRPYPAYRDSGVEWLGEIPQDWELFRLRFVVKTSVTKKEVRELDPETKVSFVPMEAVGEYGGLDLDATKPLSEVVDGYTYFRNGDVIVAKITPCFENGKGALASRMSSGIGFGTTELHVLRPSGHLDARFLLYLTFSDHFRCIGTASMFGAGGQKRISDDFIRNFRHPVPGLSEQRAIAAFLDRETTNIDGLVEKKERLIELLQEKRTALITRSVTRGLDPNVSMKDSGVEWLGKIPVHWEVKRLSWLTKCLDGKRIPLNAEERGRMQGDYPYWGANSIVDYVDQWLFDEELVLLGEDGAPFFDRSRPVAFRVKGKIWVNNHAHVLRPQSTVDAGFLAHVLNCIDYRAFIDGSTRDKLTQSDMGEIPIQCPLVNEQRAIAAFLDRETAKIDSLFAKIRQAIDHLKEFRSALISAAVTGKIDVREEAS